jgi:flotillin
MRNAPLFAADSIGLDPTFWLLLMAAVAGLIVVGFFVMLAQRYKRCPSNRILVVYGKTGGGAAKCIHGGAAFIWPIIQDFGYLNTDPMQIETPLKGALSLENIRVNVPSVFTVAVGTTPELMHNAAVRLLGLDSDDISNLSRDIIFGQLRQVIASMRIEEINRDRDQFLQSVQKSLEPELRKIGLELLNVNITDITDESGYIEAIGRKAAATAVQQAKIDVAEQEKLGQIGVAEAERERSVQVANAHKLRDIGTREADREKSIRLAELEKEQKIGEAKATFEREQAIKEMQRQQAITVAEFDRDQKVGEQAAAFEREAKVAEAEREKRVRLAEANATAVAGEAEAQARIVQAQAQLQVRQAEAFQIGETRKREADAAVQEAQNRALAKAALAQAERVEAERRAAVEAPAKAEKARIIVEAEAEAEKRRIEAQAQAQAIFAKLEAEARGQFEMLAKKGEGLERIIEACGGAQQAFQLLMLEHLDKLAETAATAISNVKFDKVIVWEGGGNGTGSATTNFLRNLTSSMPPMMQVLRDIGGVQLPEYLAKFTSPEEPATAAKPAPTANGHAPADEAPLPPKG